ncbi:MAG: protein kinase [Alphaproteobacteria bacterium]|nr:protein kinase [Alphaproteobacteria bacterium]
MAEVFLARSFGVEGFEKRVVIKRILPALSRSPHFVSMFIREAKISAMLSHPNVVQVFALGREGDDYYIAMEHIHGRDLTRLVRRLRSQGRSVPMELAVYIAAGIARGLAYAHSRSGPGGETLHIVHRDVSPHNVLLSFQGEVKLVDFGIARLVGDDDDDDDGPGGGKFAYMSPEQAKGEPIDRRSDIFSCGIVLYELLVNHRLFQDPDPAEKLRKVKEALIPDPRQEVPGLPDRLWEILQRALARSPADRYASAGLFEEDLRALLFEQGWRMDDATMGAWLRELFADELGPDPTAVPLRNLARDLTRLDDSSASEPGEDEDAPPTTLSPVVAPVQLGEKKNVAVLIVEVVGLTEVSETAEPVALVQQEQALLGAAQAVVQRYGGFLDGYVHDSLTVIFGLPLAHEDDMERALSCGRALLRVAGRLREGGQPVDLAMGVHAGEVAITGCDEALSFVARGNTLKLARRLAASAEPGQIVASQSVAARAGDRWRFAPGPTLRAKGRTATQPSHRVLGRRRRARGGGPGTRWVRRGDELDVLASALEDLADGRGGVLAVTGETGSGKSRLVRELQLLSRRAGVPMYSARATPFGGERPLSVFRDLVASVLGIGEDDPPEVLRKRLARLSELKLEEPDIAVIASLFAVELGVEASPTRDAQLTAGARLVRGLAELSPVLLAIEDVQDIGDPERDLLQHVLRIPTEGRVLWLLTGRRGLGEGLPAPDQTIELKALGHGGQRQLICDVLGARAISAELFDAVVRRAEGNPLYLVEVVTALQQKALVRVEERRASLVRPQVDPGLPPTLEGLVAARVDALEPRSKDALRLGATIGLSFSTALVAAAADIEDAEALLRDLVDAGLVVPKGRDEGTLSFSSQLIWEVVRRSTLARQRAEQHARVAAAIEAHYADHLDPHLEALAGHCAAAGRMLDAASYVARAGDLHRRAAFLERALRGYQRGVSWLEQAQVGGEELDRRDRTEAELRLRAGEVAMLLGRHRMAEQQLQLALDLAADLMISSIEMGCFLALGRLYAASGDADMGEANLEQGLALARAFGITDMQVAFLESLGSLACDRGEYASAEASLTEALELAGDDDHLAAIANLGLGTRFWRSGDAERALERLEFARAHAEAANDPILLGRVVNNLGIVHHAGGRFDRALAYFREALELRRGTGYRPGVVINLHNIGDALLRLGERGRAYAAFQRSRDAALEVGLSRGVAMNEIYLGYLDGVRGDARGLEMLRGAIAAAEKLGDVETALTGRWLEGRVLRALGQDEEAEACLYGALERARGIGAEWIARDIEADLA